MEPQVIPTLAGYGDGLDDLPAVGLTGGPAVPHLFGETGLVRPGLTGGGNGGDDNDTKSHGESGIVDAILTAEA